MSLSAMQEFYEENRQRRAVFQWVHTQGTFDYDNDLEIVLSQIVHENPHGALLRKSIFSENGEETVNPHELVALLDIQRQVEADVLE